jgi:hypothetical protein
MPRYLAVTGELGRLEEFWSEVVYPAWPAWLAGAVLFAVLIAWLAYRQRWHLAARNHPLLTASLSLALLAIAIPAGYYTLSPLFERETVCEASPVAGAGAGSDKCADSVGGPNVLSPGPVTSTPLPSPVFEPAVVTRGEFVGSDDFHFGEGQALLIESQPGQYLLRFENFSVRNGPDLFVYLSPSEDGFHPEAVNLGELKGTDGAFNYAIPAGTDVSRFRSAIVWCRQFEVLFATAELDS